MACTNIAAKATFGIWKHVSLEKLMTTSDQFQQVYGDLKPVTMFQIKSCIVFFGGVICTNQGPIMTRLPWAQNCLKSPVGLVLVTVLSRLGHTE